MGARRKAKGSATLVIGVLAAVVLYAGVPSWTQPGPDARAGLVLVKRVIDGDTIQVARGSKTLRVRLKCVDTPETKHPTKPVQPFGPEASAYTTKALEGKWVRLESDPEDQWDRYDRFLAYVFLEDGTLFNIELLRDGYARRTRYLCRFKREADEAEREARAAGRGIWGTTNVAAARGADYRSATR